MKQYSFKELTTIAREVRREILSMSYRAQSAHMGGSLSCVEILVSLYFSVMHIDPKKPEDPKRDRLIFSKAHDAKALYAVLARRGFFSRKFLERYELDGGKLPGHSTRHCVPGVEASAGSLGHGLSMAAGVAFALRLARDNKIFLKRSAKNVLSFGFPRVFCILSDGECDEGSTWEAALFAGHHKLENLTVIVDYNKLQGFGCTKDILDLEPFADKWRAFGFSVREVEGNSFGQLTQILSSVPFAKGKPSVVLAHTIKGLGGPKRHINQISSQYNPPTREEYEALLKQLS